MRRRIRKFADRQTIKQTKNRQTDKQFKHLGHSNPLWIVGGAGQYTFTPQIVPINLYKLINTIIVTLHTTKIDINHYTYYTT